MKSHVSKNLYVGKAGQLAVMGELSFRGYNTAMPEIDIGDDVFVVSDNAGALWRLQIKTSKEKRQKSSSVFAFKVKESSIHKTQNPDLHFVFAMRMGDRWRFLVMHRDVLRTYASNQKIGTPAGKYRRIDIVLHEDGSAKCSKVDWKVHLDDWSNWPILS